MKRSTILFLSLLAGSSACAEDAGLSSILAPVKLASAPVGEIADRAGASSNRVTSVATEAAVIAKLEKELTRQLSIDGELELSFGRPWQPIRVPSEEWTVTIPELPTGGLARSFIVEVRIMAQDRAWFDRQVVLQAQLMKPVYVAARRIERGTTLERSAAEVKTIDVLRERQKPIAADTELEGNEVLQTIEQGQALNWRDVGASPLVKKGSVVNVIAEGNGISVSMKGTAMQTGAQDDMITVRNLDTRKDFQGRVVKRNTVRVTF